MPGSCGLQYVALFLAIIGLTQPTKKYIVTFWKVYGLGWVRFVTSQIGQNAGQRASICMGNPLAVASVPRITHCGV